MEIGGFHDEGRNINGDGLDFLGLSNWKTLNWINICTSFFIFLDQGSIDLVAVWALVKVKWGIKAMKGENYCVVSISN